MRYILSLVLLLPSTTLFAAEFRLGIVGTDVSHVVHFTRILNDPSDPEHLDGARVVAAYRSSSPDITASRTRVDAFTKELVEKYKIELVPDIATLCSKVDGVLLESGDGRVHLAQAKQIIAAHKPLWIDKPLASTLEDAREIAKLAKSAGVPWFSSSGLRFGEIATKMKYPDTVAVDVWGPGPVEEHHYLELAWYAIHPIEMLYALLGPGCREVSRASGGTAEAGTDVIVGRWSDGRVGTVRTLRPQGGYGAVVFRPKSAVQSPADVKFSYAPLLKQILTFFQTNQPPVPNEVTLEIYSFMDAAQRSKEKNGQFVALR